MMGPLPIAASIVIVVAVMPFTIITPLTSLQPSSTYHHLLSGDDECKLETISQSTTSISIAKAPSNLTIHATVTANSLYGYDDARDDCDSCDYVEATIPVLLMRPSAERYRSQYYHYC